MSATNHDLIIYTDTDIRVLHFNSHEELDSEYKRVASILSKQFRIRTNYYAKEIHLYVMRKEEV